MTYAEKNIIEGYFSMFKGLSALTKLELIKILTKSLKKDKTKKVNNFHKSFGGFCSDKSAKEISAEIKSSRKFRKREINFC